MFKSAAPSIFLIATLLVGCGTTPLAPLSDFGYKYSSEAFASVWRCGASGLIDPATAALGLTYVKSKYFTGVTVDRNRFNAAVDQLIKAPNEPNRIECNTIAMDIHEQKRRIDINNQSVSASQDELSKILNNTPKNTYCNKIGTQVFCTTY